MYVAKIEQMNVLEIHKESFQQNT